MKHIKLLYVAILGIVVGDAECAQQVRVPPVPPPPLPIVNPVLDLPIGPNGTPGLVELAGALVFARNDVNNVPNVTCLHVIIPNTPADLARNISIPAAKQQAGNIYFPRNGVQPTTPEAVEYSCANIDNRENSPITEWYMKMFGVIPFRNVGNPGADDYIKAGWSAPVDGAVTPERIISFPQPPIAYNHGNDIHNQIDADHDIQDPDIPGNIISRIGLFRRLFGKIASTPVGRVLLYRILIEVRRNTGGGNNAGCLENGIVAPVRLAGGIDRRNKNRSISVYTSDRSSYNRFDSKIRIRETNGMHTIIGKTTAHNNNGYTAIGQANSSIDISLFHEMTHWYHYLRNPKRYDDECTGNNLNLQNYYLGTYYWSGLDNCVTQWNTNRRKISQEAWSDRSITRYRVIFEEIRTILGVPCGGNIQRYNGDYKNGDDLCENLYRIDIGAPLRFGHSFEKFYEDRKVINKVLNAANESHVFYIKGYASPGIIDNRYRRGLGNCWRL